MSYVSLKDFESASPNPLSGGVLWVIALIIVAGVIALIFGKVDIVAEAPGKIIPKSLMKTIQPSESGVVTKVHVKEGSFVKKGDFLVALDPVETNSDINALSVDKTDARLRLRRIEAELSGSKFSKLTEDNGAQFDSAYSLYLARVQAHSSQVSQEKMGLEKLKSELDSATHLKNKLQLTLPLYQQEAADYDDLVKAGVKSSTELIERRRKAIEVEKDLIAQESNIQGIRAAILQSNNKLDQINAEYSKELRLEQAEYQAKLNKLEQESIKKSHKSGLLNLVATADGVVKEVSVVPGSVVTAGSIILTIVPVSDTLIAEVWVKNEDVGFVHEGQKVNLKIIPFPFQKYGLVSGTVVSISPDSSATLNSTSSGTPFINTQAPSNTAGTPDTSIFKVLISIKDPFLRQGGVNQPLKPGMQVVADIHLGSRTLFEYFTSSIRKVSQESVRER